MSEVCCGGWARYALAAALAIWALGNFRMVFVYLGAISSPAGIGMNLPFATRSLARAINSIVYSAFLLSMPMFRATEAIGLNPATSLTAAVVLYWIIRRIARDPLRRLWFRYLAHVFVERDRQADPEAAQERSGPRFEEAISTAYSIIESEHESTSVPRSTTAKIAHLAAIEQASEELCALPPGKDKWDKVMQRADEIMRSWGWTPNQ